MKISLITLKSTLKKSINLQREFLAAKSNLWVIRFWLVNRKYVYYDLWWVVHILGNIIEFNKKNYGSFQEMSNVITFC